jgi:hypothetical protein
MPVKFPAHMHRVDVRDVFHRDLHRLEPPFLEGLKEARALVGKGRGK